MTGQIETWKFTYTSPGFPYARTLNIEATDRENAIAAFESTWPTYRWWMTEKVKQ